MPMSEYSQEANAQTFVIIQLEHEAAVGQAEAILSIEGVDFVMLGPGDFSILSGFPGDFEHPKFQVALDRLATAARNTGKHWAALAFTIDDVGRYVDAGARLVFHFSGRRTMRNALAATREGIIQQGFKLRESPITNP